MASRSSIPSAPTGKTMAAQLNGHERTSQAISSSASHTAKRSLLDLHLNEQSIAMLELVVGFCSKFNGDHFLIPDHPNIHRFGFESQLFGCIGQAREDCRRIG